ncbi:MAG: hypothetical protein FWF60_00045, partial [Oscillospiraceae bacterium]|nr:hypothetical protein [Oscillospiraceae bacterium]
GGPPMDAAVPGCSYHDLLRAGAIEDPFYGENERACAWVGESDFDYWRGFILEAGELEADRIVLSCAMLDTLCRVYVNDILVGEGHNSHIGYEFDVKDALRNALRMGENTLRIEFDSPVRYAKAMAKAFTTVPDINFTGRTHIRKAQCHFGWDWGPCLPVSGITGDISLKLYRAAKLLPMEITQTHGEGRVTLCVRAGAEEYRPGTSVRVSVLSPEGNIIAQGGAELTTVIEDPQLWWTHDLGGQPLYTVRAEALLDGDVVDAMERRVGLRTIELNREADRYGHNFQFVLNGVPTFAKGANYIPPDSFPDRASSEVKRGLLERCVRANMNMLRVWGGGFYETDEFYDACDRLGLLVWQDFAFACAPYPFDREDFLADVKAEVAYNVTRLRHHASLALWCGNNEIEAMAPLWVSYVRLTRLQGKFFWETLPAWVREHDGATPYTASSPTGGAYLKNVGSDKEGDTHLWHVWHGLQPLDFYRRRMTRFCSEFGLESLPSMEAVRAFAGPEDYDITSPVFNAHQKCGSGNEKILYYLLLQYRLPRRFGDLLYLSQLTQAECVRDATEHWRRNRGRCNGSLYWQLNDCWPVCSWAGIDYLNRGKALHFAARRFNEPVAVSIEDSRKGIKLYVINDTREERALSLSWQLMRFNGEIILSEEDIAVWAKPLSSGVQALNNGMTDEIHIGMGGLNLARNLVLRAQLKDGGQVISQRTLLFGKEKDIGLPRCKFAARVEVKDDVAQITVQSDKFARAVYLESALLKGDLSDNFIDMFSGEPVTLTACANGHGAAEIHAGLRVLTVGNIADTHSRAWCEAKRRAFICRPSQLGRWVVFRSGLAG